MRTGRLYALIFYRSINFKHKVKITIEVNHPPIHKTLVICIPLFVGCFVVRWIGSSFAFLFGFVHLRKNKISCTASLSYFCCNISIVFSLFHSYTKDLEEFAHFSSQKYKVNFQCSHLFCSTSFS